jgi:hypothetical protein
MYCPFAVQHVNTVLTVNTSVHGVLATAAAEVVPKMVPNHMHTVKPFLEVSASVGRWEDVREVSLPSPPRRTVPDFEMLRKREEILKQLEEIMQDVEERLRNQTPVGQQ